MNESPSISSSADTAAGTTASDRPAHCPRCDGERDVDRRARYAQVLGRLVEMGMKAAEAVERRAEAEAATAELVLAKAASGEIAPERLTAAPDGAKASAQIALAFSRLSHCIRMTLLLEDKLIENFRRREKAEAAERAGRAAEALTERRQRTRNRVKRLVTEAIHAETGDQSEFDHLWGLLGDRIDQIDIHEDLSTHSVAELVERICRDLQLEPDWNRWEDEGLLDAADTADKAPSRCPVCRPEGDTGVAPADRPPDASGTDPP
jgi:predicted Zn-ribbon and HTH transcriptional regulator